MPKSMRSPHRLKLGVSDKTKKLQGKMVIKKKLIEALFELIIIGIGLIGIIIHLIFYVIPREDFMWNWTHRLVFSMIIGGLLLIVISRFLRIRKLKSGEDYIVKNESKVLN